MATTMLVAPGLRALSVPQEKLCGYQLKRETHLRSYCFRPRKQSQSIRALISSGATSRWNWLRSRSIQEYTVATVAVIVVQAIVAQDVSHALPSFFLKPSLLTDFTASSLPKKSFRCSAKKFKAGVVRMRASATTSLNGSSARRQGRSKGGFVAGTTGRSLGGELNEASTVVKAAPLAVLPSSSSPLASLVNAGLHVDLNVLRASFASSLNLISLCSFVVWMQRSGQLPAETPVVLSQVAFRVLIPCFLMTKVAVTLASHPSASLLMLPLLGFVQVVLGALIGKAAYRYVYGKAAPAITYSASVSPSPSPVVMSSSENGAGVITQVETPVSTITLRRHSEQYIATKREAIITTACAFGNSFTLPLIFMTGVLGAEETSKVAGYLALYMAGWSPALWTLGYYGISAGDEDGENASKDRFSWESIVKTFKRIMNPPLYGVLVGVLIGGTPLSHLFLPVANECAAMSTTGALAMLCSSTAGILKPVVDAAALLGTATLAVQTIVLASSLAASLPPLGKKSSSKGVEPAVVETEAGALDAVLDTRAFWIISSVRLIAMPGLMIIATVVLQFARILPVDPVYNLLLLTEAAMPSAQNLVLLSQLRASTRRLSGVLADLLLRQYALSIIPITFWMALFLAVVKPV